MALADQIGASVSTRADRPCPICLCKIEKMKELQKHIAQHLVDFSLFSLPRIPQRDIEDEMSGKAVVHSSSSTAGDDDFGAETFHSYGSRRSNLTSDALDNDNKRRASKEQRSSGSEEYSIHRSIAAIKLADRSVQKSQLRIEDLIIRTQDMITDLMEFQPYVPNAASISALVSELYAIGAGLQDLITASNDPKNFHDARIYTDARWVVTEGLKRTLQDLDRYIRRKDISTSKSRREAYSSIWAAFNDFFFEQSNNTLFDRLNCFKLFLQELVSILSGNSESRDFQTLYQRIDRLIAIQDDDLRRELEHLE
ncbi:MAG: hypothetical protein GOMPHAMPRED_005521 [Gomphillus americanus]|uniref:C2H2-type domain-containing protein n=1 Tax=Gomphillus americanus TaxID=1940652 RepID=A0A8H3IJ60_9LECA|nr:MAG: hypothetical protein GOMPHAMPRED_005521 [Gomphillus americanus]